MAALTFLQICQGINRESGTASGDTIPSTVTGQTGRGLKIVTWAATAWRDIQRLRPDWLWMRVEFSGAVSMNTPRYTGASWGLTRLGHFITERHTVTIYNTALGVADETEIRNIPWAEWRIKYGRGAQTPNRPIEYAISPQEEFCLGPIPDKAYTVRGEYQQSAQDLVANGDMPECPSDFHDVIVWKGLLLLAQYDEGQWPTGVAQVRCQDVLRALETSQLPKPAIYGSPVA